MCSFGDFWEVFKFMQSLSLFLLRCRRGFCSTFWPGFCKKMVAAGKHGCVLKVDLGCRQQPLTWRQKQSRPSSRWIVACRALQLRQGPRALTACIIQIVMAIKVRRPCQFAQSLQCNFLLIGVHQLTIRLAQRFPHRCSRREQKTTIAYQNNSRPDMRAHCHFCSVFFHACTQACNMHACRWAAQNGTGAKP